MKKTDASTIKALREHAELHPEDSYVQMAATFGLSEITVKRHCADLGRGKDWRRGRKQNRPDGSKFWNSVNRQSDGCWPWTGSLNNSGYGMFYFDGRMQSAHRVAYELTIGPIPEGKELDHKCCCRACCNPAHLEPLTHSENMERVRSLQSQMIGKIPDHSCTPIDTGSSIDTPETAQSDSHLDSACTLVKEDKLNTRTRTGTTVSVSIEPAPQERPTTGGFFVDPFRAHEALELERIAKEDADDKRWGISSKQLAARMGGADQLRFFWVTSRSDEDRISVWRFVARSEEDAKDMFASVWGSGYEIRVQDTGQPDGKTAINMLFAWRSRLRREFEDWKATEAGRRCFVAVSEKNDQRERAERREREMDEEVMAYMAEQEAHFRKRHKGISSRPQPHQPKPTGWDEYDPSDDDLTDLDL